MTPASTDTLPLSKTWSTDRMAGSLPSYTKGADGKYDGEYQFSDMIDIINPLQHIPLIGNIYREITGDEIKPSMQAIGGTIFGGMGGAASGIANAIVAEETGKDIGQHALSFANKTPSTPTEQELTKLAKTIRAGRTSDLIVPESAIGFASSSIENDSPKLTMERPENSRMAGSIPIWKYG